MVISMGRKKLRPKLSKILMYFAFLIILVIVLVPILITLFAAFRTTAQLGAEFPLKPPTSLYLDNFKTAFIKGKILLGLKNSMILVVVTVAINTIISSMAAYAITRFEFKLKKVILLIFTIGMIVPSFVTEISRFQIINNIGLYNSLGAPILIYAGTDLLQIYIYMQFMNQIPFSLDESSRIDGCSYLGTFWKIIFPNVIPATATLAILKTVTILNDMYVPYLYMPSEKLRTLTTSLMSFAGTQSGSTVELSACVIFVMIPTILLFLFFQKYIFEGVVSGAVKG